ncbi:MAG TPA: parallel beta-helix domain-containing protein [Gemmataceae bacterium]|nr:parallel beta-helix domain-containing protein [Gemmataceae bacterium]
MAWRIVAMVLLIGLVGGCGADVPAPTPAEAKSKVIRLRPGPNAQEETQTALIKAKPGDTVEFAAGTFDFTMGLSLAVEGVTVRGQGMDQTALSFKKQNAGSEGLLVTRGNFVLEDLSIDDTKGDAIKVNGAENVICRRVRTQWTSGSKTSNGAYGLYPVQCKNVLIEKCVAIGASDAGIYVGQSRNIIVRGCRAERNVAGIEIENCIDADVYENTATDNAGGLLVFDLPGLQVKNGRRVRVFKNQVLANNHENFAPKGNTVATVSPGTGIVVMATDQVEVFQNTVKDNQSFSIAVSSYYGLGKPLNDKEYDPIPEGIYIHDNAISGGGMKPAGEAAVLAPLLGKPVPDIVFDGVRNASKFVKGVEPPELRIYIKDNGKATFANLHFDKLDAKDPAGSLARIEHDLHPYEGELPRLAGVQWPGVE